MLVQLGAGGTQKHLILTGLRGVGKTVLLNEFEASCEAVGWSGETREAKSYAERGFEFRRIGALDRPAAAAALEEPARQLDVIWERSAVERVIDLTGGYPYFLQEYGRAIWRIGSGRSIGSRDVKAAELVAGEYLDENFFSQRIGKLPGAERRYLWAIAWLGDGSQRTGDVAKWLGKNPADLSVVRCGACICRTFPDRPPSSQLPDQMREERLDSYKNLQKAVRSSKSSQGHQRNEMHRGPDSAYQMIQVS